MEAGNWFATGGVSSGIMAAVFIFYKCCYRKKLRSKCCGAEMDIGSDTAADTPRPTVADTPPDECKIDTTAKRLSGTHASPPLE